MKTKDFDKILTLATDRLFYLAAASPVVVLVLFHASAMLILALDALQVILLIVLLYYLGRLLHWLFPPEASEDI